MMTIFKNQQQVKLLALTRTQDSGDANNPESYRYISFVNVSGETNFLILESSLVMSVPKLMDFLIKNGFSPKKARKHGDEIREILIADTQESVDLVKNPG